jgi:hypothetical protein
MRNLIPIVPGWIYSLADYRQMFDLSDQDCQHKILNIPGGLSSFNAEMYARGHAIVGSDLFWNFSAVEVTKQVEALFEKNKMYLHQHMNRLRDPSLEFFEQIIQSWKKSKDLFLQDYEKGKAQGRYCKMQWPKLAFADHQFDLVLCSDLLFNAEARAGMTSQDFLSELCRVALEVRVFPLLDEKDKISQELGPLLQLLQAKNFGVEIRGVPYEEQQGSNAMLRIWNKECVVEDQCDTH